MDYDNDDRINIRRLSKSFNMYRLFITNLQKDIQSKNKETKDMALYISDEIFKHAMHLVDGIKKGDKK